MANPKKCPDSKWLHRLAAGKVNADQEKQLAHHLEHCESCQTALDQINDLSGFVTPASQRPSRTISTDSNKLRERLQQIKSNTPANLSSTSGYMDVMPWLDESESGLARLGQFEVIEFVGRGGMGVVFKGFDTVLGTSCRDKTDVSSIADRWHSFPAILSGG